MADDSFIIIKKQYCNVVAGGIMCQTIKGQVYLCCQRRWDGRWLCRVLKEYEEEPLAAEIRGQKEYEKLSYGLCLFFRVSSEEKKCHRTFARITLFLEFC